MYPQRASPSLPFFDFTLVSAILLLILKSGLSCSCVHFYLSFVTFLLESKVGNWKWTHTPQYSLPNMLLCFLPSLRIHQVSQNISLYAYFCLSPPPASPSICGIFLISPFLFCFPSTCSLYPLMLYVQLFIESRLMVTNASEQSHCRL